MAELKDVGRILGVIGGILMIVFSIVYMISSFVEQIGEAFNLSVFIFSPIGETLGESSWMVAAILMLVCGLIVVYGYRDLEKSNKKDPLLLWGILYLVLGIIGGGLGGLLVLIAGVLLLLDYFM